MSITVGAIISGTAGLLILTAAEQRASFSSQGELIDRSSTAMEVMLRYIREVGQYHTQQPGSGWVLNDEVKIGDAESQKLTFDIPVFEYLFSVGASIYEGELDSGTISPALRNEFTNQGISLSPDAVAIPKTPTQKWSILDGDLVYTILKVENNLNISGYSDHATGFHLILDTKCDTLPPRYILEMTTDGISWYTLAKDVISLKFTYYDWLNDPPNNELKPLPLSTIKIKKIRRISIQIELEPCWSEEVARLRTSLYLRNFMNEVIHAP